jgi:hypothetical protein
VIVAERLVEKHLTKNQMFGSGQIAGQRPLPKSLPIYISWYINGYGRPWTSSDVNPKIRPVHGQIPGTGGVLLATTDQKVGSSSLSGRAPHIVPLTSGEATK